MEEVSISMVPWIKVIASVIGWVFFIICLAMLKNAISQGISIAISDFLMKNTSDETREKTVRWLGNGEVILEQLKEIDQKLANKSGSKFSK